MLIDTDGRFQGYASKFGVPDQGRDMVMPGAFKASLVRRGASHIRMLFQHDPKEPIGRFDEIKEDQIGLRVSGQIFSEIERGSDLVTLLERRAIDGLSIGFRTQKATRDRARNIRQLWQVDLWEVSIVTFPMMEQARILPQQNVIGAKTNRTPAHHAHFQQKLSAAACLLRQNS